MQLGQAVTVVVGVRLNTCSSNEQTAFSSLSGSNTTSTRHRKVTVRVDPDKDCKSKRSPGLPRRTIIHTLPVLRLGSGTASEVREACAIFGTPPVLLRILSLLSRATPIGWSDRQDFSLPSWPPQRPTGGVASAKTPALGEGTGWDAK